MSETATIEKEADHHPYRRPVDAATLILVDRSGAIPKVLVGKRHDKVVFMPGKFVFPGGRVDASPTTAFPSRHRFTQALETNLLKGSPEDHAVAGTLARSCRDPRGLRGNRALSRTQEQWRDARRSKAAWKPFSDAGLLPDPSSLLLIARAITPPGRVQALRYTDFSPPTPRRSPTMSRA